MAEEARRIIQENGRKYIERILSAVTESGFDLRAVPTVFMGGGSTILKRHVTAQDAICRLVFIEDVHANATGYEPVSYTHLDVYKRQRYSCDRTKNNVTVFPVI